MPGIVARIVRTWPAAVMAILAGCVVAEGPPPLSGPAFCTREYAPVCGRRGRDRDTFQNACEADRAGYFILHAGRCRRVTYDGPPPPERPRFCTSQYDPVCARRGRERRTFGNECEAERAGYRVIRDRACRRDRDDEPRPRPDRPRPEQPRPDRPRPEQPRPDRPRPEQPRPDRPRPEQPDRPRPEQPDRTRPQPEQPRPAEPRPPASGGQACTREYAPVCAGIDGGSRTFANACEARAAGGAIIKRGAC